MSTLHQWIDDDKFVPIRYDGGDTVTELSEPPPDRPIFIAMPELINDVFVATRHLRATYKGAYCTIPSGDGIVYFHFPYLRLRPSLNELIRFIYRIQENCHVLAETVQVYEEGMVFNEERDESRLAFFVEK